MPFVRVVLAVFAALVLAGCGGSLTPVTSYCDSKVEYRVYKVRGTDYYGLDLKIGQLPPGGCNVNILRNRREVHLKIKEIPSVAKADSLIAEHTKKYMETVATRDSLRRARSAPDSEQKVPATKGG